MFIGGVSLIAHVVLWFQYVFFSLSIVDIIDIKIVLLSSVYAVVLLVYALVTHIGGYLYEYWAYERPVATLNIIYSPAAPWC